MDIQFFGANCIILNGKQGRLVIDDNLDELGAKSVSKEGDIALFTGPHKDLARSAKLVIDQPGEYETAGISIYGILARAHMDEEKQQSATIYKIVFDDTTVLVTGHIYPDLTDDQLEAIGMIDVMLVPVGNSGYTLDAIGALKLIKEVGPKVVIPTHYDSSKLKYPVPQQTLEEALKTLGMEPKETVAKFKPKAAEYTENAQLIILEQA